MQRADFNSEEYTKIDDIRVPGVFPGRAEVFRHTATGDVFQATPQQYRQSHWEAEPDREIGEWQSYGEPPEPEPEPAPEPEPDPEPAPAPEPEPSDSDPSDS